jgi:hypothetical protein
VKLNVSGSSRPRSATVPDIAENGHINNNHPGVHGKNKKSPTPVKKTNGERSPVRAMWVLDLSTFLDYRLCLQAYACGSNATDQLHAALVASIQRAASSSRPPSVRLPDCCFSLQANFMETWYPPPSGHPRQAARNLWLVPLWLMLVISS